MSENAKYPDTARGRISAHVDALQGLLAEQVQAERSLVAANAALDAAYRERAHLVALLAALHPSHIGHNDPDSPDWAVVTIELPTGQACWHIAPDDMDLFAHVTPSPRFARRWDGHSTEEKYARVRLLTAELAPVLGRKADR